MLFLDAHPGWTWRDLVDTPDDVVQLLKRLDAKRAERRKR